VTPAEIVKKLNSTWLRSEPGTIAPAVRDLFTEDAVVVGPNLQRVAAGGDATARSYDDFVSSAHILDANVDDPIVDAFADVAVATVTWSMTYEYQAVQATEHGHEIYVLRREDGAWKICWRQIVSYPASSAPSS
jgi:ketosteroid isomerase-like protein